MPRTKQQALEAEADRFLEHVTKLAATYGPITEVNTLLCQARTGLGVVMRLARRDYRTHPTFRLRGVCPICGQETWSQPFEDEIELLGQYNNFRPSDTHKTICYPPKEFKNGN